MRFNLEGSKLNIVAGLDRYQETVKKVIVHHSLNKKTSSPWKLVLIRSISSFDVILLSDS